MPTQHPAKQRKVRAFHLAAKDREHLTTNLALLIRAAVPISDALDSLAQTSSNRLFKAAIAQIQDDIDNGYSLSKALGRSHVISGQTLALITLGEQSGNLSENLAVAAKQEEKQRIFQAKIRSALMYPGFVLGLLLVVGLGVAWFLLPRLSETFAQLNVELPLISKIFIGFGVFLKDHGVWAVPAFLAVLLAVGIILFGLPRTKHLGMRLAFRTPGISRLLFEVETARFGYLLGTLLRAGLSVTQALQLLHDATSAPGHKALYATLRQDFEDGFSFKSSFGRHRKTANRLIPPAVQQMIIAGEQSGALDETLLSVGRLYEEKADVSTKNLEVILEPLLLTVVAAGVLMVALAVLLPVYGLVGGLDTVQ
jgi:type II secretory pathway component PulF